MKPGDAEALAVLRELRALLADPKNDYTWSSWVDENDARREVDARIAEIEAGNIDEYAISFLFLPTGPAQEVAVSSGWGDELCRLADRFDARPR